MVETPRPGPTLSRQPKRWGPYWLYPDGFYRLIEPMPDQKPRNLWHKYAIIIGNLAALCWHSTPLEFWGHPGWVWQVYIWQKFKTQKGGGILQPGEIRAPLGGVIESVLRRRRLCISCGKPFWRKGWWFPLYGVNIYEEHCSGKCAEADLNILPY